MLAMAPLYIGLHLQRSHIFHDRPVPPLSQLSRSSQPAEPAALRPPASPLPWRVGAGGEVGGISQLAGAPPMQ